MSSYLNGLRWFSHKPLHNISFWPVFISKSWARLSLWMNMMNLLMLHICFVELHFAIGNILPSHRIDVVHKEKIPLTVERQQQSAPLLNVKNIRNTTNDSSWPAIHWIPKPFFSDETESINMVYQETIKLTGFPKMRRSEKKKASGKSLT